MLFRSVTQLFRRREVVSTRGFSFIPEGGSLLDALDGKKPSIQSDSRKRLSRSLGDDKIGDIPTEELSDMSMGIIQSVEADIQDILHESLTDNKLYNTFKGVKNLAALVHFPKVTINRDFSHVTAYWSMPRMEKFVRFMRRESELSCGRADIYEYRAIKSINKTLQDREPQIRSIIIKHVNFRRVPRVFFKHFDEKNCPELKKDNINELFENEQKRIIQQKEMLEANTKRFVAIETEKRKERDSVGGYNAIHNDERVQNLNNGNQELQVEHQDHHELVEQQQQSTRQRRSRSLGTRTSARS